MVRFAAAASVLFLLGINFLPAQTPDSAVIRGSVVDAVDAVLPSVDISITDEATKIERRTVSSSSGTFSVAGLAVQDRYTVSVQRDGFAPLLLSHVQLVAGTGADLRCTLRVTGQTSNVWVNGIAGEVRTDQPQLGIFISGQDAQQVPLPNRRITYLPLLNAANRPAINQGDVFMNQNLFNTNGAGRRQAWFEADGANSVDMWGRQTIFTNIPLMAISEMTVLTNAYAPEYGAGTGSVENMVTNSGGNRMHGALLELWRPEATEATLSGFNQGNATSGNQVTSDLLGQTAAMMSGPLDDSGKTHFYATGEWNREAKASPISSPIGLGSFVGHYRGWLGLLRLDRQIRNNQTAFLRANFDDFTDTNPNGIVGGSSLPSVARTFHRRTYSLLFGHTAVLNAYALNDIRAQFQLASPITEFDPVVYGTQFSVPITSLCGSVACGTFTSGTSQSALLMNRQYEVSDTVSLTHGRHQFAAGADVIAAYNGGNSKEFGGPIFLGKFTYNPCSGTAAYCESSAYLNNIGNVANYQQSFGKASYKVSDQLWSLFAQETLRVSDSVNLSAGLRYEHQTLTDATKNFAPRIGLVWKITGNGSLVFRGGFGPALSQIVDNAAANYALGEPTGIFTYTATLGQTGFPSSIAAAPLSAFPAGAAVPIRSLYVRPGQPAYLNQFFPTSTLNSYPGKLLNPYSEQWTASLQARLAREWVLSADYVGAHTVHILRTLDIDAPAAFVRTAPGQSRPAGFANCTRPYWIWWYGQKGIACQTNPAPSYPQPAYSVIQTDVNNGYLHYDALDVNLTHAFRHGFSLLASYTLSHTLDNVDPDATNQNPNDPNLTGEEEYGPAIYDQRHRGVVSGVWAAPFKINLGGVVTLGSALPFNYVVGAVLGGDTGGTTDRPVINGAVVGRNMGRGRPIYSADPFISRAFPLRHETAEIELRAEAFNVLNHHNFVGYNGNYGNNNVPALGFGAPLSGVTAQLPARSMQFSAELRF